MVRLPAKDIVYEIQHWAEKPLTEYRAGVVINLVDNAKLPKDAFRVSINLIQNYIKVFDREGLLVAELPFDGFGNASSKTKEVT